MADVRQRKPVPAAPAAAPAEEEEKSKNKPRNAQTSQQPNLEPSLSVMVTMLLGLFAVIILVYSYKTSNANGGPFAAQVNTRFPVVSQYLNRPTPKPLFGASAQATTTSGLSITEADLAAYDGSDPDTPIYLAINGTIFDVSASPAFYGPGGHYHHFVGKDASRAWVTECWDATDQFTWRMDGVEAMFMPKWLDEQLESAAAGTLDPAILGDLKSMPANMLADMAKKAMERFGTVTESEKSARRAEDVVEANAKVHETLAHWVNFFSSNPKYKVVGTVVRAERAEPPVPCDEAMKKRPIKGGKLESMMGTIGKMMGGMGGAKKDGDEAADAVPQMPAFIKEKLEQAKASMDKKKEEKETEAGHEEL